MPTTSLIPSYSYIQFADDENIAAWFSGHNEYAQSYLDWFSETPLAIYTNSNISGELLDWVANGVYGIYRTPIATVLSKTIGEINTYGPDSIPINQDKTEENSSVTLMTDDIFKRLITWDFYKGDGPQFTIPWIKNRVARFLYGINGYNNTNNISVKFTSARNVQIQVIAEKSVSLITQQLYNLLLAGIPNFPYGYSVTMYWVDSAIVSDDFGGDIV